MLFKFEQTIKCENPYKCAESIEQKLRDYIPNYKPTINGHLSISHGGKDRFGDDNPHKIWFFLYEETFESELNEQKQFKKFNESQEMYNGFMPELKKIKKLLD